jgi:uncharacterized membrane protein
MPGRQLRLSETGRVEAFSDGVFAIAATLLVLDLRIPEGGGYLHEILEDWPNFVAYLAAFLTIASIWLHHHNLFSRISRLDARLAVANLVLLLGVSFLPWPTSLLAASLRQSDRVDEVVAVAIYATVSVVIASAWSILTWSLARRPGLLRSTADMRWMRANFTSVILSTIPVVLAVPIAFIAPVASLALYVAVPLYFFVASTRPTEPDETGKQPGTTTQPDGPGRS